MQSRGSDRASRGPTNSLVTPLLNDLYQVTMAYAYFKTGKHTDSAVFDLFFRKCPFKGEFAVFAGLEQCVKHAQNFHFSEEDITFVKETLGPDTDPAFFEYLRGVDCSEVKIYAMREGSLAFPRVPLLRVEGPLAVCQLLETTFLNLVNYPSLIATNAAHHRLVAGPKKRLIEFGLRRAQGPDGALSGSKYSYVGGFDGTSNVEAGKLFGIPVSGTHAHAFVSSFTGDEELASELKYNKVDGTEAEVDFPALVEKCHSELGFASTSPAERKAFTAYAMAFPRNTLCLVDTYDTLKSGVPNFLAVAYALHKIGFQAKGIRLDSGDLAYLSTTARELFAETGKHLGIDYFKEFTIVASNDLNVENIHKLNAHGHEIDVFGVGTNLITCQNQPALGCVYKLVEINGVPRIKLSQDIAKVTIPGKKNAYRLFGSKEKHAVLDIMLQADEEPPQVGKRILCRHPFAEHLLAHVTPSRVQPLHELVFKNGHPVGDVLKVTLDDMKATLKEDMSVAREDHLRHAAPYKISVSQTLYDSLHSLWLKNVPVEEL